jgi:hypothetical protein
MNALIVVRAGLLTQSRLLRTLGRKIL